METSRDLLKVYEINHNGFENFHTNSHALSEVEQIPELKPLHNEL